MSKNARLFILTMLNHIGVFILLSDSRWIVFVYGLVAYYPTLFSTILIVSLAFCRFVKSIVHLDDDAYERRKAIESINEIDDAPLHWLIDQSMVVQWIVSVAAYACWLVK